MKQLVVVIAAVLCACFPLHALAASGPLSAAQIALYQGKDREQRLIEGAKKEGQLVIYDSHTWFKTYVKEFEKKYPLITVSEWRNDCLRASGESGERA